MQLEQREFTCNAFVSALNLYQPVRDFRRKVGVKCTDPVKSEHWNLLEHLARGWWRVSRAKRGKHLGSGPTNVCMYDQGSPAVVSCVARPPGTPMLHPPTWCRKELRLLVSSQGEEGEGQPTAVPVLDTISTMLCNLQPCQLLSRQNDAVPMAEEQYDLPEEVWLGMFV